MLLEVGLIVAGVPLGYAVHKIPCAVRGANFALSAIIYALLFLIGLNLGSDENLLARVGELGLQGIIVGVLSALGSIFVVCFLFRSFFAITPKSNSPSSNTPKAHD